MFADGFLSITLEGMLGLLVTVVGIWFVVQQLREARLASQMEGYLMLMGRFGELSAAIEFIDDLGVSQEWNNFSNTEAYNYLIENELYREFYKKIGIFSEGVSALLRRGVLDEKLAFETFGRMGVKRFHTFKKAIDENRMLLGEPTLNDNWEWLAIEFEDMSK